MNLNIWTIVEFEQEHGLPNEKFFVVSNIKLLSAVEASPLRKKKND